MSDLYVHVPTSLARSDDVPVLEPPSKYLERQRTQQRVSRPTDYQNYNLFALVLILFLSLVMPIVTLLIRQLGLHLLDPKSYQYRNSEGEGLLQLHRMALEGVGYCGWKDGSDGIPHTNFAEKRLPSAVFEYDEDDQPMLRYPKAEKVN